MLDTSIIEVSTQFGFQCGLLLYILLIITIFNIIVKRYFHFAQIILSTNIARKIDGPREEAVFMRRMRQSNHRRGKMGGNKKARYSRALY